MKNLTSKLFGVLLALTPIPVWAFDCDTTPEALIAALPGTWRVTNDAGTLSFGGQTMVLPAGNGTAGEIIATENGLSAQDWGMPGVYPIEIVTDMRYVIDTNQSRVMVDGGEFFGPLPDFISGDEVRLLAGCKKGEISPQLSISGTFQDPEGPVDFQVYLFAVNKDTLYGVTSGHLKSMNGRAKRITRWTRSD